MIAKTNVIKIILDVVMSILLILTFNKRIAGIAFHEIVGIIVCVFFIVHVILNKKWISGITKNFLKKNVRSKTRVQYVLNALLLCTFLCILITGLGMSKSVLPTIFGTNFGFGNTAKMLHFFFTGVAVVLLGIHIGLHWKWIKNTFCKIVSINSKRNSLQKKKFSAISIVGLILLLIVFAYGCYSLTSTNLVRWLSIPFSMNSTSQGVNGGHAISNGGLPSTFNISTAITVLTNWFSIIVLIACITYFIELLFLKLLKKKIVNQ